MHIFLLYIHTHIYTLFCLISYIYILTQKKKKEFSVFDQNYV